MKSPPSPPVVPAMTSRATIGGGMLKRPKVALGVRQLAGAAAQEVAAPRQGASQGAGFCARARLVRAITDGVGAGMLSRPKTGSFSVSSSSSPCSLWLNSPRRRRALTLRSFIPGLILLACALLSLCPIANAQQLTATQAARAKSLSLKVKCMCGGCNDPAGACYHSGGTFSGPCDMALSEIKLVNQKVAAGESDDQVLKDFVAQYGPTVLVDPPKRGFDLTAWLVPVLVPLIALIGVWEVVRRWRQKHPLAAASASASQIPPEILARVQRDIEKDEP